MPPLWQDRGYEEIQFVMRAASCFPERIVCANFEKIMALRPDLVLGDGARRMHGLIRDWSRRASPLCGQ